MIIILLAVVGLIFGSFVDALVWRLHEQDKNVPQVKHTGKKRPSRIELSMLHGRSMCPNCYHTLAAKDLVPVLSWLSLRGKCRYCHAPISWQSPLMEVTTAALFVGLYLCQGVVGVYSWVLLVLWLAATVLLVALSIYDIRWRLLPTRLVYGLVGLAALTVFVQWLQYHSVSTLLQPVLGAAILYALFRGLFEVSKGAWLGYGDVRLVVALGLLAGTPLRAFMLLFFASLIGTFAALPGLLTKRTTMTAQIPFGPYLIAGLLLVQLWGASLLSIYRGIIGY